MLFIHVGDGPACASPVAPAAGNCVNVVTVPILPNEFVPTGKAWLMPNCCDAVTALMLTTAVPVTAASAVILISVNPTTSIAHAPTVALAMVAEGTPVVLSTKILALVNVIQVVPPSVLYCADRAPVYVPDTVTTAVDWFTKDNLRKDPAVGVPVNGLELTIVILPDVESDCPAKVAAISPEVCACINTGNAINKNRNIRFMFLVLRFDSAPFCSCNIIYQYKCIISHRHHRKSKPVYRLP